eukprot:ANDGO_07758.mRNA.1 hypothetical protein
MEDLLDLGCLTELSIVDSWMQYNGEIDGSSSNAESMVTSSFSNSSSVQPVEASENPTVVLMSDVDDSHSSKVTVSETTSSSPHGSSVPSFILNWFLMPANGLFSKSVEFLGPDNTAGTITVKWYHTSAFSSAKAKYFEMREVEPSKTLIFQNKEGVVEVLLSFARGDPVCAQTFLLLEEENTRTLMPFHTEIGDDARFSLNFLPAESQSLASHSFRFTHCTSRKNRFARLCVFVMIHDQVVCRVESHSFCIISKLPSGAKVGNLAFCHNVLFCIIDAFFFLLHMLVEHIQCIMLCSCASIASTRIAVLNV